MCVGLEIAEHFQSNAQRDEEKEMKEKEKKEMIEKRRGSRGIQQETRQEHRHTAATGGFNHAIQLFNIALLVIMRSRLRNLTQGTSGLKVHDFCH